MPEVLCSPLRILCWETQDTLHKHLGCHGNKAFSLPLVFLPIKILQEGRGTPENVGLTFCLWDPLMSNAIKGWWPCLA